MNCDQHYLRSKTKYIIRKKVRMQTTIQINVREHRTDNQQYPLHATMRKGTQIISNNTNNPNIVFFSEIVTDIKITIRRQLK